MRKKVLLISLAAFILGLCFICFYFRREISAIPSLLYDMSPERQKLYQETKEKLQTVKLGTTKGEVKLIMGSPINIVQYEVNGQHCETWYYPDSRVASEPSRCVFDKKMGKVIMVVSGDEYCLRLK